jgi:hypothetical protein
MEQTELSLVLHLREQLRQEKEKYLLAIENGKELVDVKEIMYSINVLQTELEKLIPYQSAGYHGF